MSQLLCQVTVCHPFLPKFSQSHILASSKFKGGKKELRKGIIPCSDLGDGYLDPLSAGREKKNVSSTPCTMIKRSALIAQTKSQPAGIILSYFSEAHK